VGTFSLAPGRPTYRSGGGSHVARATVGFALSLTPGALSGNSTPAPSWVRLIVEIFEVSVLWGLSIFSAKMLSMPARSTIPHSLKPEFHAYLAEKMPWLVIVDILPR
jgi:hypothetical protein